jgi:hypothetical protein
MLRMDQVHVIRHKVLIEGHGIRQVAAEGSNWRLMEAIHWGDNGRMNCGNLETGVEGGPIPEVAGILSGSCFL